MRIAGRSWRPSRKGVKKHYVKKHYVEKQNVRGTRFGMPLIDYGVLLDALSLDVVLLDVFTSLS